MAQIKFWNGSSWVNAKAINVWNGSSWVRKTGYRWTGSAWEPIIGYEKVYAIGGEDGNGTFYAINERYDPLTNTWQRMADAPYGVSGWGGDGAAALDGKIYIIDVTGSNLVYDLNTNTWSNINIPPHNINYSHTVTSTNDSIKAVYVMVNNLNMEYLISLNRWYDMTPMPTQRHRLAATTYVDDSVEPGFNKIVTIGGVRYSDATPVKSNEEYSHGLNSWSTKAQLPTAIIDLWAATVDNKVYAGMGTTYNGMYNPSTNTWSAKASPPTNRYSAQAASAGGKIYVIAGRISGVGGVGTNEEYDPITNTWSTKAGKPTVMADGVMVASA